MNWTEYSFARLTININLVYNYIKSNKFKGGVAMANTINVNIRMDKDLKQNADAFFDELGLTMTAAVNIFIRQALRQKKIPFELSTETDPFYSPSNLG
jgi:DNA-damage-inducible protein J